MSLISKLAEENSIPEKISCVDIISLFLPTFTKPENKNECFNILKKFLSEEFVSPMVKIETGVEFKNMINYFSKTQTEEIVQFLVKDPNDSIRIHIIKALSTVSPLPNNIHVELIKSVLSQLTEDLSWRVRYTCAQFLPDIIKIMNNKKYYPFFIECFNKLIIDKNQIEKVRTFQEEEIRNVSNKSKKSFKAYQIKEDKLFDAIKSKCFSGEIRFETSSRNPEHKNNMNRSFYFVLESILNSITQNFIDCNFKEVNVYSYLEFIGVIVFKR